MRIVLLKEQSQYDVLRQFTDELANGFAQLGTDVFTIDLLRSSWQVELQTAITVGIDAVISFNGIGIDVKNVNGELLFETVGIPCLAVFVDHPIYQYPRIVNAPSNTIFTFIDPTHVEFSREFMGNEGSLHCVLPHAGTSAKKLCQGKDSSVMFSGTYKSSTLEDKLTKYSSLEKSLLLHTYEEMNSAKAGNFHQTFMKVLECNHLYFADRRRLMLLMSKVFIDIDRVRASENRLRLLDSAEQEGVKVDIYGPEGWSEYCHGKRFLSYGGQKNYREVIELNQQYKFVLNDNNDFFSGSHERHFDALVNGACPVSPRNSYYESGQHGSGVGLFFERNAPNSVIAELKEADNLFEEFQQGIASTTDDFRLQHHWLYRASEILDLLQLS